MKTPADSALEAPTAPHTSSSPPSASSTIPRARQRPFGKQSSFDVSVLGFGAGQIGGQDLSDDDAARLLHAACDLGVTLFDTARSYGRSEARLGRAFADRRGRVVLSTKGGYGVAEAEDWSFAAVARGIDEALASLGTDYLDIFHLHSCSREVLARGDVLRALDDARRAGKIRLAAYSGENDDLSAALGSDVFGSVQLSINVCDRNALHELVPRAEARGLGVIAKRPLANAPWRHRDCPHGEYVETYWHRFRTMGYERWQGDWAERALRFSAFAPGVSSVILGTRSLDHLASAAEAIARGPLPADEQHGLGEAWSRHGQGWHGEV